jgi:hypothetical protein
VRRGPDAFVLRARVEIRGRRAVEALLRPASARRGVGQERGRPLQRSAPPDLAAGEVLGLVDVAAKLPISVRDQPSQLRANRCRLLGELGGRLCLALLPAAGLPGA